jgi:hypothetical protein
MPVAPIFRVTFASVLRAGERAARRCGPILNDTVIDGSEEAEAALRSSSLVGRSNITGDCAPGVCASVSRSAVLVISGLAGGGCLPNGTESTVLTASLGSAPFFQSAGHAAVALARSSASGFATNQSLLASLVGNPGLSLGE